MQKLKEYVRAWYDGGAGRRLAWAGALTALALVSYVLGVKFILLPALVAANALFLPLPAIFKSFFSRLVVGGLVTAVLLQIAATAQFLALPESGFRTLAVLTWLLHIIVLLIAPTKKREEKAPLFTRHDGFGLIVALFFLLPFTPILAGQDSVERIAKIGSVQAIDATNHFAGIAEMTEAQHFTYKPGYYYPKGFHIAQGFAQNTVFGKQADLGWNGSALLYFSHYVVAGVTLAFLLYYLALAMFLGLVAKLEARKAKRGGLWLALALGPTAALVYLVPFVTEGFLNYYYVITTIAAGLIVLLGLYAQKLKDNELPPLKSDAAIRWGLFLYLLLIFGASVSWPLLIPPLVLIAVLVIVPANLSVRALLVNNIHWRTLAVLGAFLLQLLPVYFQLKYSGTDGSQGINLTGGLKEFHPYVLLGGFLLVAGLVLAKGTSESFKRALLTIFIPLAGFIGLLIMLQYYSVGEIRYYVIKSSMLLEILVLVLGVAALVYKYLESNEFAAKYALLLPVVPFVVMIILIGSAANPMKAMRDLFRAGSGLGYPAFYHQDVSNYVTLGGKGDLKHFNSTVLHYNFDQKKFFAHMQMPFWNNMMQYNSSERDFKALHCVGALYSNIAFGGFTQPEQDLLVQKVKECASVTRAHGDTFYLLTDKASAPVMRETFGDLVKLVY